MPDYTETVERQEIFHISDHQLDMERIFQVGKADRKAGKPCASANGAYLNGWYSPELDNYYIPAAAAHLLKSNPCNT